MNVSVIIPVLKEADRINSAIDSLPDAPESMVVEVVVVDGDSSGTTVSAIKDSGVRGHISSKGRGVQMNYGAGVSSGDVLVFLHADTVLPPGAFRTIAETIMKKDVAGGAFDLGIDSSGFSYRLIERAASLRSRLTRIPYGDQAIYMKRSWFNRLGGYRHFPVMEDVDMMQRLKQAGGRIHISEEPVKTSPRRWKREGIIKCTLRNWLIRLLYLSGTDTATLYRYYR